MDAIEDRMENELPTDKEEDSSPTSDPESAPGSSHELDWEDDPRNPYNWSDGKRLYHTVCVSLYAFTVTYMSSAYAPGAKATGQQFHVSETVSLLGISLFCLGLAFGPMIGAPLSETAGRLIVYRLGLPIATLFLIGAATSKNIAAEVICRFFAGVFGSPALSVGGGTMADMWPPARRGPATALFVMAPFMGPCIAPIIGGFVVERLNWRWLEWVSVFWGVATCVFALGMKETYKKKILERDNKESIKEKLLSKKKMPSLSWGAVHKWVTESLVRPMHLLFTEPIVLFLSLYIGFDFAVLYAFFASLPLVFQKTYGFNSHQNGLVFISLGVGTLIATMTNVLCDRFIYQRKAIEARERGDVGHLPPEQRLYPAMMGSLGVAVGLFWFAWTARSDIHWISPVLALIPFNWGNLCIFATSITYMIDCYGARYGASALSANAFTRYVFAAAFPLFIIQMYNKLTTKWAASLLGFIAIGLIPIPWILFVFGEKIRKKGRYAL
ncbi:major facilitator superfamily domain-containing protein [Trichoderma breve]|uniref:Major facilitator superfamily domain-containing protein n=1 Tax=Trichoderma breve TaxID=2034170 RepID=A0A9W9E1G4_9HYPO|nr:major facilitator superfamily domain-containing protein [Trichoderma breve]KAJ4854343.1 major facilitator superfamily domain-containing protein [Trichoderma breve]